MRVAPAITGPATSQIARAAEPTKGQAWAFPEEDIQRLPSAASQSLIDSRRSSIADSLASSQFTTESRLPPGQRRLDEGMGTPEFQRISSTSGEFPAVHHHTLQHKQLGELQAEEAGSTHRQSAVQSDTGAPRQPQASREETANRDEGALRATARSHAAGARPQGLQVGDSCERYDSPLPRYPYFSVSEFLLLVSSALALSSARPLTRFQPTACSRAVFEGLVRPVHHPQCSASLL